MSLARALDTEPMRTKEEEDVDLGTGGPVPTRDVGGEGATSSQPGTGESSILPYCSSFLNLDLVLASSSL